MIIRHQGCTTWAPVAVMATPPFRFAGTVAEMRRTIRTWGPRRWDPAAGVSSPPLRFRWGRWDEADTVDVSSVKPRLDRIAVLHPAVPVPPLPVCSSDLMIPIPLACGARMCSAPLRPCHAGGSKATIPAALMAHPAIGGRLIDLPVGFPWSRGGLPLSHDPADHDDRRLTSAAGPEWNSWRGWAA